MLENRPLVLATVGSDHHQFDRLVSWLDDWYSRQPEGAVRCVIQHGTSQPPQHAEGHSFLKHEELQALMDQASVIVTQGGPMSIVEARRAGKIPIVVPRDPSRGEHVDGHQQVFARRMGAEGQALVPSTQADLSDLLERAIDEPSVFEVPADDGAEERVRTTSGRMSQLVDRLVPYPRSQRPCVLLIVGVGRSGSTLFERTLAGVDGVEPLGETVHLWERGVRDDELCGCGERFSECVFWSSVGYRAFGGWDRIDIDDVIALRHAVVRTRFVPELLFRSPRIGWRLQRDRMARLLTAVFEAAREESGCDLLVDSSKMPAYAALLSRADLDLRCVQVVRDPRGVAHSWSKVVRRPEVVEGSAEMHRYTYAESALWWTVFDAMSRLIALRGVPVTSVRYEDFVADPQASVGRVLDFAGHRVDSSEMTHVQGDRVELQSRHLVAGNPMRFRVGEITITPDEEWRSRMPARQRRLVSALTYWLRRRYGY